MGTISVSLPSDGQTIDAADYNTPINTIVTEINGSLDSNNIAEGGVVPNSLVDGTGTSWTWQTFDPSFVGWSGTPTEVGRYIRIGNTVFVYASCDGTSNTTGVSFTLPIAPKVTSQDTIGRVKNNGTTAANPGMIVTSPASTTAVLYRDMAANGWTASGDKTIYGFTYVYEANS